jgi:hypothetical protein
LEIITRYVKGSNIVEIKLINICYPIHTSSNKAVLSHEFLHWAKSDLKGGDRRARGNALSNIKKSIHSRIDEILSLSHISYSSDWNSSDTTDEKIALLKKLNIEHTSIVKIITKIRNVYEHQYILPSDLTDIKAYYETTELWLNHSEKSLIRSRLGIINLPVYSVECDSDRIVRAIQFPKYVDRFNIIYFWDSKNIVATLTKDNREQTEKTKEMKIAKFIELENKHLKTSDKTELYYLTANNLSKVFNTYKKTLDKREYGFYLNNPTLHLT